MNSRRKLSKRTKFQFRTANHNSRSMKLTCTARAYRIRVAYTAYWNNRTPLRIDAFWDKPTPNPTVRRKKWRVPYKLALLAKQNIILGNLIGKNLHIMIDTLSTAEFWKIVEAALIQSRNITFGRHVLLITKHFRGAAVEQFYGKLE